MRNSTPPPQPFAMRCSRIAEGVRFFVTGTDTDVGKTRVTAALARAFVARGERPTVVKLAQTGVAAGERGDADTAGRLAGCDALEFARFALPADPWSAALAEDAAPLRAATLAARLDDLRDPLVVEGAGGVAVPLNATETLLDVAAIGRCDAIVVVVALRLGCINHARLTLEYVATRGFATRAIVYVERDGPTDASYRSDVARALVGRAPFAVTVAYDVDAGRSVDAMAAAFADVVRTD